MKAKSSAAVLKAIDCDKLSFYRSAGYWYFAYDDVAKNVFETESVYVCYLNQLTVEQWAEIGREFVKRIEEKE